MEGYIRDFLEGSCSVEWDDNQKEMVVISYKGSDDKAIARFEGRLITVARHISDPDERKRIAALNDLITVASSGSPPKVAHQKGSAETNTRTETVDHGARKAEGGAGDVARAMHSSSQDSVPSNPPEDIANLQKDLNEYGEYAIQANPKLTWPEFATIAENYFAGSYVVEYAEHNSGDGEPKRQLFVTAVPGYDSQRASDLQEELETRVRVMGGAMGEKPPNNIREGQRDLKLFEGIAGMRAKELKEFEKVPENALGLQAARKLLEEHTTAFRTTGKVTVPSLLNEAAGILEKGEIRG
jgi:hypothetical protein